MAEAVRRRNGYRTYGNVAYDEVYAPAREGTGERVEPLVRPRERVRGRAQVRVRPAGYVAPAAVLGFVAVAVVAVLMLMSFVHITELSNQVVRLRRESTELTEEHSKLLAQYELAYDLKSVEEQMTTSGAMVQPQAGQLVTLDLAEPDSVYIYEREKGNALGELWDSFTGAVRNVVTFFQ